MCCIITSIYRQYPCVSKCREPEAQNKVVEKGSKKDVQYENGEEKKGSASEQKFLRNQPRRRSGRVCWHSLNLKGNTHDSTACIPLYDFLIREQPVEKILADSAFSDQVRTGVTKGLCIYLYRIVSGLTWYVIEDIFKVPARTCIDLYHHYNDR